MSCFDATESSGGTTGLHGPNLVNSAGTKPEKLLQVPTFEEREAATMPSQDQCRCYSVNLDEDVRKEFDYFQIPVPATDASCLGPFCRHRRCSMRAPLPGQRDNSQDMGFLTAEQTAELEARGLITEVSLGGSKNRPRFRKVLQVNDWSVVLQETAILSAGYCFMLPARLCDDCDTGLRMKQVLPARRRLQF